VSKRRRSSTTAHRLEAYGASRDKRAGRNDEARTSATSSSPGSYDDVIGKTNARSPRWFVRHVRQVCDGGVSRSGS
jgi:hypothetical protein